LLAFIITFVCTPWVRNLAHSRGWLDDPKLERKVHDKPIPRVGGIAIAIGFYVPLIGSFLLDNDLSRAWLSNPTDVLGLLAGSVFMLGLGFTDDLWSLSAKSKFLVQTLVALALFYGCDLQIVKLANPFGGDPFALGALSLPVTLLWLVGVVNAINLIDGLDGLATGTSLVSVLTLFVVSLIYPNPITALTCIVLAGALLGFLPYNFNPASIFMGDSGSLFLGFILATTSILGSTKASTAVALAIPILALGFPIMDTTLALYRRVFGGRPMFKGDREHIHHRLLDLGLTHIQAVLTLYAACLALAGVALSMVYVNARQAAVMLGLVGVTALVVSVGLGYFGTSSLIVRRQLGGPRRLGVRLEALHTAVQRVQEATTIDGLLDTLGALTNAGMIMEVHCAFDVRSPEATRQYEVTKRMAEPSLGPPQTMTCDILGGRGDIAMKGSLSLTWATPSGKNRAEAPAYAWLALVIRDQVLTLEQKRREHPAGLSVHSGGSEPSSSSNT
jgi:UDP-GlcNAc:undecaprenyl-phosphate GlcNAc-1-phosphate transferase